jgi:hypothetical protein
MPAKDGSNSKHIQEMFSLHPNNCIIGIYNNKAKTIHLALSIDNLENTNRVWLLRSEEGNCWTKGWKVDQDANKKYTRGAQLPQKSIDEFNANPTLIPRLFAYSEDVIRADDCYASHDYFLFDVLKDKQNIEDYLGFSLTTKDGKLDEFVPVSGLLNNRDDQGKMVRDPQGNTMRKRGATLPSHVQGEIVGMIEQALVQEKLEKNVKDRFFIFSENETKAEAPERQVMPKN